MSFDWGDYQPYTYPSYLAQNKLPRPEARRIYMELMSIKDERIRELRNLFRLHAVELDDSDTSVRALNEWVRCNVEADPSDPTKLAQRWVSVLNDVALYLGELMISRNRGLKWEFYVWGKKDIAYQHHVIMGFTNTQNAKYNVDLDRIMLGLGNRVVHRTLGERDIELFIGILASAAGYA